MCEWKRAEMTGIPETDAAGTPTAAKPDEAAEDVAHVTFVDVVRRELGALEGRLDMLRVDAVLARMDGQDQVEAMRRELSKQRDAVGRRIDDLADASASAWRTLRDGVDSALSDLRKAIERARAQITR